jgi:hypothetical protein
MSIVGWFKLIFPTAFVVLISIFIFHVVVPDCKNMRNKKQTSQTDLLIKATKAIFQPIEKYGVK